MKNGLLTVIVGLAMLCQISAQNNISGQLLDDNKSAISFANVILHLASDSTMIKVETTDLDGYFELKNIPTNSYWLTASYVGLSDYNSEVFQLNDEPLQLGAIQMEATDNELSVVTVVASRPILEIKPDKLVFNVEGSVNAAGSDGLELLRKAPGVVIDNNDNISLAGKNGVQIFINGKASPLSGDDLAAYLRNLRSEDIDNIEIITNPSSKYDAEGNAGIINLVMKKDQRLGANGRLNLGVSQGIKLRYNGGISGNYKNKKVNVFGGFNSGHYAGINDFDLYREQANAVFNQVSERDFEGEYYSYNAGLDYFINDKNTIGILIDGSTGDERESLISKTYISDTPTASIDSILVAETKTTEDPFRMNNNINYQLKLDKDKNLNMDLDYGIYKSREIQDQPNFYKNATEDVILFERIFMNYSNTDINIGTFKIDYDQPLGKGKIEMGMKSSFVQTDNLFNVFRVEEGIEILEEDRSRKFKYIENVNAVYSAYQIQIKDVGIQLGLRVEQTYSKGDLTANISSENDLVERKYIDFFPSLGIAYKANDNHSLQFNYSRRLQRPNYQDLNPFQMQLDELVFQRGNPFLNPEYSNSVKVSHVFKSRLNSSLSYTHTKDMITELILQEDNKIFNTKRNIANQQNINMTIAAPFPITKWWNTFTNISSSYIKNSTFNPETNLQENLDIFLFSAYIQNNFDLPWGMKLEISGWYNSPSLMGFLKMEQMYSIDAGIQKSLLDGKAKLKLGIDDIFYSQRWRAENQYGVDYARAIGKNDSRKVKLNFSYSFGNQKVKSRRRNVGNEDESNRL
jgi:iron complex outermembrane receptor protein